MPKLMDLITQVVNEKVKERTGSWKFASEKNGTGQETTRVLTKNIRELGKEFDKTFSKRSLKALDDYFKKLDHLKQIRLNTKDFVAMRKELDLFEKQLQKAKATNNTFLEAEMMTRIKLTTREMVELDAATKDVVRDLKYLNAGAVGKGLLDLEEFIGEKWKNFATLGTSVGFLGNALYRVDTAGDYVATSLKQMPIDEVAASYDKWAVNINSTDGALTRFGKNIYNAGADYAAMAKETSNAIGFQNDLTQATVETGKTLDELKETSTEVMTKFNMNLRDNRSQILETTLSVTKFGQALNIGTGEAIGFFEKKIKELGGTTESAQRDLASMVGASDELKHAFKDANFNTQDFTHAVMKSVDADVRSSQNIRIKTELMEHQIAVMLKQGKTMKEAMEAGQAAANSLSQAPKFIQSIVGFNMADEFEKSAKALKGMTGEQRKAATEKMKSNFLAGVDPKDMPKMTQRFDQLMSDYNKGIYTHYDLAQKLEQEYGSQRIGQEKTYNEMRKHFATAPLEVLKQQFIQQGMNDQQAQAVAEEYKRSWADGLTFQQMLSEKIDENGKTQKKNLEDASTLDQITTGVEKASRAIAASKLSNTINAVKSFINNPIVSTAVSAAAGLAHIYYSTRQVSLLQEIANNTAGGGGNNSTTGVLEKLKGARGTLGKLAGAIPGIGGTLTTEVGTLAAGGAAGAATIGAGVGSAALVGYGIGKYIANPLINAVTGPEGLGGMVYDWTHSGNQGITPNATVGGKAMNSVNAIAPGVAGTVMVAPSNGAKAVMPSTSYGTPLIAPPTTSSTATPGAASSAPGAAALGSGGNMASLAGSFMGLDNSGSMTLKIDGFLQAVMQSQRMVLSTTNG